MALVEREVVVVVVVVEVVIEEDEGRRHLGDVLQHVRWNVVGGRVIHCSLALGEMDVGVGVEVEARWR